MAAAAVVEAPPPTLNGHLTHEHEQRTPLTLCIGDLHGYLDRAKKLWENLRVRVGHDAFEHCTVIFLGDFCDRGPDAKGVLDWLISLKSAHPHQKQVFLAGNHDFSFAAFAGCLPPAPEGFDFKTTWPALAAGEEKEGWYTGPGHETMHVQGRRWAGVMKELVRPDGKVYDMSTFDSGATFRSYGVDHADREALLKAMPQEHRDFLQNLVWIYEQDGVSTGDPSTSYSKLICVHAGLEAGRPAQEQYDYLRSRDPSKHRIEELSGRKNVYENLPELEEQNVLVISGHHGVLDTTRRLRLIIDQSGGLDRPIAAIILPSREIVRDTDEYVKLAAALAQ